MTPQTIEIIKWLLGGVVVSFISAYSVIKAATRNSLAAEKSAQIKADSDAAVKLADGHVLLQAKLVDGQGLFEDRVLSELKRQDSKMRELEALLDDERKQRRLLETALHLSDIKIGDLEKQVVALQDANRDALTQIVRLNDENRQRKVECEEQIRLLTDELAYIKTERDELKARLEAIRLTRQIGSLEHIDAVGADTNARVKKVEQKVDEAAETLRQKEQEAL
jgi:chromosome segregation ATPase